MNMIWILNVSWSYKIMFKYFHKNHFFQYLFFEDEQTEGRDNLWNISELWNHSSWVFHININNLNWEYLHRNATHVLLYYLTQILRYCILHIHKKIRITFYSQNLSINTTLFDKVRHYKWNSPNNNSIRTT